MQITQDQKDQIEELEWWLMTQVLLLRKRRLEIMEKYDQKKIAALKKDLLS